MDDHMLLRRLRRRDPSALEAVMDRYLPYVRAIVGNVLRTMPPEDDYPRLSIEPGYDEAWTNDTEMILSSAYDFCEVHTTRDGVDVLIQGSGSRIWAEAKTLHTRVNLFTDCCTREEIIEVVEHLHLAALFGQMQ